MNKTMASDSDLTTIELIPNPNVHRSGLEAYGYLLSKYGFNPTKPGPFSTVSEVAQGAQGAKVAADNFELGSKKKPRKQLQYNKQGKVPAEVVRNDFEWLCPVKVGTPAKVYNLVFDSGSADTWVYIIAIRFAIQQLMSLTALVHTATSRRQYLRTPSL